MLDRYLFYTQESHIELIFIANRVRIKPVPVGRLGRNVPLLPPLSIVVHIQTKLD